MQSDHDDVSAEDSVHVRTQSPAAYGAACAGCAKAKCKCVRDAQASSSSGSATGACQRCRRLGTPCQPSQITRRRGGGRRNRTAQIENKLDSLFTLLRSQAQSAPVARTGVESITVDASSTTLGPPSTLSSSEPLNISTPSTIASYSSLLDIDPLEAEESLQLFRSTYLAALPLVYIPPTTTDAQLRVEKPHLWLAIHSVCCKPFSARAPRQETLRRIFAERVTVNFERNMDLLLGQIVFTTWGNMVNAGRLAFHMNANMAATLAQDLKLDRGIGPERGSFEAFAYGLNPSLAAPNNNVSQRERTNEERRSVLACYCLCSSNFHKLGTPPMRWTPHMTDCLRHLSSQPECENDEVLVVLARCSSILDDVFSSSTWGYGDRQAYARSQDRPPPMLLIKALREALDEVRHAIRPPILERSVIKFWLLTTEVMIFDLALQSPGSSPSTPATFTRAEHLQYCLSAINTFFENFASFKPQDYIGLHLHYWLHFMRCTRIVYRLLLLEDAAWDSKMIRESVDLMGWLQRGADICRATPAAVGLDTDGNDGYHALALNMQQAKSIWTIALQQAGVWPDTGTVDEVEAATTSAPVFPDTFFSFDMYDDSWLANAIS